MNAYVDMVKRMARERVNILSLTFYNNTVGVVYEFAWVNPKTKATRWSKNMFTALYTENFLEDLVTKVTLARTELEQDGE